MHTWYIHWCTNVLLSEKRLTLTVDSIAVSLSTNRDTTMLSCWQWTVCCIKVVWAQWRNPKSERNRIWNCSPIPIFFNTKSKTFPKHGKFWNWDCETETSHSVWAAFIEFCNKCLHQKLPGTLQFWSLVVWTLFHYFEIILIKSMLFFIWFI